MAGGRLMNSQKFEFKMAKKKAQDQGEQILSVRRTTGTPQ